MGCDLAGQFNVAAEIYRAADAALQFPLSRLMLEGPESDLMLTENTQPAIFTASIAYLRVLEEKGLKADFVAGHSLGEYSALVAAGALDFADGCRLLRERGRAMQRAVPQGEGAMAAFLGLDASGCEKLLQALRSENAGVIAAAGYNAPGQIVLSGDAKAVSRAMHLGEQFGAKRASLLQVSAPFHCPLMKPAEISMTPLLRQTHWKALRLPYVANATAEPADDASAIANLLIEQICSPVLWQRSLERLWEMGVRRFIEVGSGTVLTGLAKRTLPKEAQIQAADKATGLAENLAVS